MSNDRYEKIRNALAMGPTPGPWYLDGEGIRALVRELLEERDALREALKVLVNWTPSADTYRRLGFDPEAPMRAHDAAKALLAKGNKA